MEGAQPMRSTCTLPISTALTLVLGIVLSVPARADDQESKKIDSKVLVLRGSQLTPKIDFGAQPPPDLEKSDPYKSGLLSVTDAQVLINGLRGAKPNDPDDRVTIIHILRWKQFGSQFPEIPEMVRLRPISAQGKLLLDLPSKSL